MEASISEAKNKLSALLRRVRQGESVLITHRGRPVAKLVPASWGADQKDEVLATLQRQGVVKRAEEPMPLVLLNEPLPQPLAGSSALRALFQERQENR